jgi:hypothetical protein
MPVSVSPNPKNITKSHHNRIAKHRLSMESIGGNFILRRSSYAAPASLKARGSGNSPTEVGVRFPADSGLLAQPGS